MGSRLENLRSDRANEQRHADASRRAGYGGSAEDRERHIARIDREIKAEENASED